MNIMMLVLLALVLFQIKHFLADFVFQTVRMLREKGQYGRLGGVAHAATHGALSIPAVLLFGLPGHLLVALILAEVVVHYHIDWLKEKATIKSTATPRQKTYWIFVGLDQGAHQLTYIAMTAVALSLTVS